MLMFAATFQYEVKNSDTYHFVQSALVRVSCEHKLLAQDRTQRPAHLSQLVDVQARGGIDECPEVLVHVLGRPELLNRLETAVELVTENRYDVVARHHALVVDECLRLSED